VLACAPLVSTVLKKGGFAHFIALLFLSFFSFSVFCVLLLSFGITRFYRFVLVALLSLSLLHTSSTYPRLSRRKEEEWVKIRVVQRTHRQQ
jgi:hypothetical protein